MNINSLILCFFLTYIQPRTHIHAHNYRHVNIDKNQLQKTTTLLFDPIHR
uniref:Uncharacterized protein n=1 Tax=Octopus bimaculoides TaxID=37653 RepID=A0A0L8IFW6_OCTBM